MNRTPFLQGLLLVSNCLYHRTVFSYVAGDHFTCQFGLRRPPPSEEIHLDDLPVLIGPCLSNLHIIPVEHLSITDRTFM